MFCSRCGNSLSESQRFCSRCGMAVSAQTGYAQAQNIQDPPIRNPDFIYPSANSLSPIAAVLLTFLITGLSQMIMGQIGKGFAIFGASFALILVVSLVTCGYGAILALPLSLIFACVDAYNIAAKLRAGKIVGKWEFF
jgi:TM2 domain-containing membrane protein YozV